MYLKMKVPLKMPCPIQHESAMRQTQSNILKQNQKHYKKNQYNNVHKNTNLYLDGRYAPWIDKAVGSANNDGT